MLRKTIVMIAVMSAPMVAEAQRGGRPGPIFNPGPEFGGHNKARIIRISSRIAQTANYLARESRHIQQTETSRGNFRRAQKFGDLHLAARQLAIHFNRTVLPIVQSHAPEFQVKQIMRSSRSYFVRLDSAVRVIGFVPYDVQNLVQDIKEDQSKLRSLVFGGGGPYPPQGRWAGTCEVVLETLWGTNIRSFYGTSFAATQYLATQQARMNGVQQCQSRLSGLMKCSVTANCGATIVRR